MVRVTVLSAGIAVLATTAAAQELPEIDIKTHCAHVGGGSERIAACLANENHARLWLKSRRIDPRVLYQCSQTLDAMTAGYVLLQACVQSKRRM
jgi:hypothetical protein